MTEFISNLIGNDYIATTVMSFVPLIELKGAIVYARALEQPMSLFIAFLLAYVGSTLVFFPIYWLLRPILNLMKKIKWFSGFAQKVEDYFKIKAENALKKQARKTHKKQISDTLIKHIDTSPDLWFYRLSDRETARKIYLYRKNNRYLSLACKKFIEYNTDK
jgi:hypothetical protein